MRAERSAGNVVSISREVGGGSQATLDVSQLCWRPDRWNGTDCLLDDTLSSSLLLWFGLVCGCRARNSRLGITVPREQVSEPQEIVAILVPFSRRLEYALARIDSPVCALDCFETSK